MSKLPLDGVRVLDITVVWAGPFCATLLADMGAEVIRIESISSFVTFTRGVVAHPSEAMLQSMAPMQGGLPGRTPGARPWNRAPGFNSHGRNKLGMTVDLLQPKGMEVFKRLVSISDVFVENNASETIDKLGISYELLRQQKPDIIMLRMPAYGNNGAYKNYRAHGTHIEGVVGHSLLRGYADMDPSANSTVLMPDAAAATQGAFAVLSALHYRNSTGKGQLIELSQAENVMPLLGEFFLDHSMNGRSSTTIGNRHPYAIQGCYPCSGDDRWVSITIYDDADWAAFCTAIGDPIWTQDNTLGDLVSRYKKHNEIDRHIGEWTSQRDPSQVMQILQASGVAAGPVMDQRDAYNDAHLRERGMFEEVSQEDTGTHWYPGAPFKMSETPIKIRRGPVRLGEDNEYVYKSLLEYSDQEYDEMEREGHIGMDYV